MPRSKGGLISQVRPDTVGEEIGLEPGDRLISINGHALRDVIDYQYYGADEELVLVVEREGKRHRLEVERDYDEELGLDFSEPLFDGLRQCRNRCPFCFVRQLPKGMRPSLYLRDDDYRYSFLLGNFVTLTNLSEQDWRRIGEQHLSPLYVSIHATDLAIRRQILGDPDAPDIVAQLDRLAELGIEAHGQMVVSPGINDGEVLRRSIEAVSPLWPTVLTLAIVPVGLTRYHHCDVRPVEPAEAEAILDLAERYHPALREQTGRTWLYPSDELYLLAGRPIPPAGFYDDEGAQLENGVGLVRRLMDDWQATREGLNGSTLRGVRATLVCGALISPILQAIAAEFNTLTGSDLDVVPVTNQALGETVTVSGLLMGQDVLAALQGRDLGRMIFLPRAMFDAEGQLTLDDLTPAMLQERLGAPVKMAATWSQVLAGLS